MKRVKFSYKIYKEDVLDPDERELLHLCWADEIYFSTTFRKDHAVVVHFPKFLELGLEAGKRYHFIVETDLDLTEGKTDDEQV